MASQKAARSAKSGFLREQNASLQARGARAAVVKEASFKDLEPNDWVACKVEYQPQNLLSFEKFIMDQRFKHGDGLTGRSLSVRSMASTPSDGSETTARSSRTTLSQTFSSDGGTNDTDLVSEAATYKTGAPPEDWTATSGPTVAELLSLKCSLAQAARPRPLPEVPAPVPSGTGISELLRLKCLLASRLSRECATQEVALSTPPGLQLAAPLGQEQAVSGSLPVKATLKGGYAYLMPRAMA
mmetsp:Transcript_62190/g.202928  ORF Transcript_62190/g.202928 Transcript_62190/m.202928 type:complete len:242 (-) Transcript_62190:139-864(-)|eukprot:CAMPEP_0203906394 /NCGR_PEP_ID=MMETSP0359-20131031/48018_1 /ASSEMBLY_ACC=CAM_ASM_000338 /TAXON_ID=268821 /ORGANISM="Scrippsiella Hangoei, Strain SHTV-5" /LENGTH=241 /DNA_ID=CAMNT_0050831025 /DNA_START=122 /DNA_END=847 /DNA_ORIENTATION=+